MNQKELKELIEFLIEKDIAEFELERGDVKLRVKRAGSSPEVHYVQSAVPAQVVAPVMVSQPAGAGNSGVAAENAAKSDAAAAEAEEEVFLVKSRIVGTYYESPS